MKRIVPKPSTKALHWIRRPIPSAVAVLLLGMGIALIVAAWQAHSNQTLAEARFHTLANRTAEQVAHRVGLYEDGLRGVRGNAIGAGDQLTQASYRRYAQSREIDREFPGARGMGIILRVTPEEEAAFVAKHRRDEAPDFAIRHLTPHDEERFVIRYIEPVERNVEAVGLDIGSEKNRRTAAIASMQTGKATLTGPITLVQATGKPQRSFLIMIPIFEPDALTTTPEERVAATVGWAYAPIVIDEVLADFDFGGQFSLSLEDVSDKAPETFFATSEEIAPAASGLHKEIIIPLLGRTWCAEVRATPEFVKELHLLDPRIVAGIGSAIAALLAVLMYLFAQSAEHERQVAAEQARRAEVIQYSNDAIVELNANLESQVLERTALLESARHDLQNILDAVPAVISYWDASLHNRFANRAHKSWFDADPDEMPGREIGELLGPQIASRQVHLAAALRGEPQVFEGTATMPQGGPVRHTIEHYIPDVRDGEVFGFYLIAQDVTQQTRDKASLATALRDNQALLRTIHQHAIVSVSDRAGHILDVNQGFCAVSGYTRAELLGGSHSIINSGVHDEEFWREIWRTISAGQPWRGEICNRAKGGELYWVDSMIAPFIDDSGEIEKYISIVIDITAAKAAEHALRANQQFLDRAERVAGVGAWQLDLDTLKVTWSAQMHRIHEVEDSYQPKLDDGLAFFSDHAQQVLNEAILAATASGEGWDLELQMVTARGRAQWVRTVGEVQREDDVPVRVVGILQDITERKEVELSLANERHLMASLLDNLPDLIHFKDCDGRFLRVNPEMARRLGLNAPDDAIGKTEADFRTGEQARQAEAHEAAIMATGQPFVDLEEEEHWTDRSPTWSLTTKMPLRDCAGATIGTFGVSRDITSRKQMEADLQETNERFALAVDGAGIGVWEWDLETNTLKWDDWMFLLYGSSPTAERSPYQIWIGGILPDDQPRAQAEVDAAIRGEREFDTEFRVVHPSGQVRHLKASGRVVRDDDGKPVQMVGVSFDITERKRAELELIETSSLLQNVLESASEVSLIAMDPDLNIKVFNKGAERLLGYSSEEMVGRATPIMIHDLEELQARSAELAAEVGEPIEGGAIFTHPSTLQKPREWTYVRKDGSRLQVSLTVTAMQSDAGVIFGYLGVAHDVTQQTLQQNSLREAMHRAEEASLAKSHFLANMSHEIRSPMNAVIGLSYVLGQTTLDSDQAALCSKIRLASKSLLELINDILDLSKIEAGELIVESVPFRPLTAVEEVRDVMAVQAETKGIGFELEVPEDLPPAVEGDVTRLKQILTNLVSNAIKFTDHGGIKLRARVASKSDGGVLLHFEVEDCGIGIPAAIQSQLFKPFAQADASTTRRFGGTGLGLSIVKRLANMMGGDVGMSSIEGVGSKFWVTVHFDLTQLTLAAVPPPILTSPADAQHGLLDVRVLVVDDSDINLDVAKRILELEGAHVALAPNGLKAIERLQRTPTDFDVILMDVQMPAMDGHEATRIIRGELGLTVPIIALTADARTSERQRTEQAGMNDFLSKPFDPAKLVALIRRYVPVESRTSTSGRPAAQPTTGKEPWPEITGIDTNDAQMRMGGDADLFRKLLTRLLDEFSEIRVPRKDVSEVALFEQSKQMHKLKGAAGQLGACEVSKLASQAERACKDGDGPRVVILVKKIQKQLQELRHNVRRAVLQSGASVPPAPEFKGQADPAILTELRDHLVRHNLAALDLFAKGSSEIGVLLGKDATARIDRLIQDLQFDEAAGVLAKAMVAVGLEPSEWASA